MKNSILAAAILVIAAAGAASGQVNPALSAANSPVAKSVTKPEPTSDATKLTRARVLNQTQKNPSVPASAASASSANGQTFQAHAKANFKNRPRLESLQPETSLPVTQPVQNKTAANTTVAATTAPAVVASSSSQIYRVGIGDVLDVKLNEYSSQESTLFTVLKGGMLEYPLAGTPLQVTGLTTNEIAAALRERIKFLENPTFVVNVRDYASHTVSISGFVAAPGTKTLRREAMPLFAVLAESLVLPEATRVTINRGANTIAVDLKDPNNSATLILPGDQIKVWP